MILFRRHHNPASSSLGILGRGIIHGRIFVKGVDVYVSLRTGRLAYSIRSKGRAGSSTRARLMRERAS